MLPKKWTCVLSNSADGCENIYFSNCFFAAKIPGISG